MGRIICIDDYVIVKQRIIMDQNGIIHTVALYIQ